MISEEAIRSALSLWGISLKTIRPDLNIQGSPERSLFRTAFEGEAGGLFVLERIAPERRERKLLISQILDDLNNGGLSQIVPYFKTPGGTSLAFCDGSWWQLSAFMEGTPLDRPLYVSDDGKGRALADFLRELSLRSKGLSPVRGMPVFSIKDYILNLEKEISQHTGDVAPKFAPIFYFLRCSFMDSYDRLPLSFCHGDYHPLNIIWRGDDIAAVIDWEFCGFKPEIYDAANLIGCIGMEHPSGLTDKLALSFIRLMLESSSITARSWRLFPEFVIALRFAWLAEWLRGKDTEMIDLEEEYMNLLVENVDRLKEAWETDV